MAPATKPASLLIADDDENDYVLLNSAARRAQLPAQLCRVKDGLELLEYLRGQGCYRDSTNYPRSAVVLLDLNMPRKNGKDTLREIRQDPGLRSLPVVIFTTSKSAEEIQLTYEAGANSFITKPPEFQRLVEIMEVLKHYWFQTVALPGKRGQRPEIFSAINGELKSLKRWAEDQAAATAVADFVAAACSAPGV